MSEPTRRKMTKRLILLALLCIAGGVYFDWRQVGPVVQDAMAKIRPKQQEAAQAPKEAPAVPVGASDVKTGDFPVVLTGLGTVQPYNTVLVRSRVDGQVVKIAFEEGQIVHQGDLLVEIDPRPYQAALDQAKAKKEQDAANLENTKRDLARSQSLDSEQFRHAADARHPNLFGGPVDGSNGCRRCRDRDRQRPTRLRHHPGTDYRAGWFPPRRSG